MLTRTAQFSPARLFPILLFLATFFAAMHRPAVQADAAQVTLNWRAPSTYTDGTPAAALGGYKIYQGTTPGSYSQNLDVGNVTSYTLTGLNDGATYYYALSAYDTAGIASDLSNELSFTAPAATPTPLYTLSAAAGAGGSISPSGSIVVSKGVNQTFSISPSSGYTIAGVTVDGTSVGAVSTYTFSNVAASHTILASFTPAAQPATGTSVVAIDAGGTGYSSASGIYTADTGFSGGRIGTTSATIAGTPDGVLYRTERYGNFSYAVPLANGTYNVTLKFAEIYWTAPGRRIFSVTMNGRTVISNLDLYATVGKNKAYDVVIPATVTNGVLNIGFVTQADNATVSAIQITPTGTTVTPAGTVVFAGNAGGSQFSGSAGITYAADSKFSGGSVGTTTAVTSGTLDGALYKDERYGNFTYSIPATNGNYSVTLKFAEIYWAAPGKRIFSVAINGRPVLTNLDLYATVGKNRAYDVEVPVTVTNGSISISFTSQVDNATVSAVVVKTM